MAIKDKERYTEENEAEKAAMIERGEDPEKQAKGGDDDDDQLHLEFPLGMPLVLASFMISTYRTREENY